MGGSAGKHGEAGKDAQESGTVCVHRTKVGWAPVPTRVLAARQAAACAAIVRSACSNTSGGWPPEMRCLPLMITAGTACTPWPR
jgi:hypothetical protein